MEFPEPAPGAEASPVPLLPFQTCLQLERRELGNDDVSSSFRAAGRSLLCYQSGSWGLIGYSGCLAETDNQSIAERQSLAVAAFCAFG